MKPSIVPSYLEINLEVIHLIRFELLKIIMVCGPSLDPYENVFIRCSVSDLVMMVTRLLLCKSIILHLSKTIQMLERVEIKRKIILGS